jgi:hypothetical protein
MTEAEIIAKLAEQDARLEALEAASGVDSPVPADVKAAAHGPEVLVSGDGGRVVDYKGYAEVMAGLVAAGYPGAGCIRPWDIVRGLVAEMEPQLIVDHFLGIVSNYFNGSWGEAMNEGHAANFALNKKVIPRLLRGEGVGEPVWKD